jgi:hypothetical protein
MTDPQLQQPAWQPPAARPPLGQRQKAGAALAGSIGFVLLSLGFTLFGVPLALLTFGAFAGLILRSIGRFDEAQDVDYQRFVEFFERLNPEAWVLPLVLVALLGLAIMAAALYLSARILRSHDVEKPWAVTWAGAGVAIVGSWVVSGVLGLVTQLFSFAAGFDRQNDWGVAIAVGTLSFLLNLAAAAVVGWLSWWWMAHLMRPALPATAKGTA